MNRREETMAFGEKLRGLRRKRGLSQEELAAQLEVSRQAVSKWESGQGYPETDKLLRLSALLGCSLDYLLKEDALPDGNATEDDDGGDGHEKPGYYVSRETAQGYLYEKQRRIRPVALGVAV